MRKVRGVPQSQTEALSRHQEEEETDKTKHAQIEQTYEKRKEKVRKTQEQNTTRQTSKQIAS